MPNCYVGPILLLPANKDRTYFRILPKELRATELDTAEISEFESIVEKMHHDIWSNNLYIWSLFPAENILIITKDGIKRLCDWPDYEKRRGAGYNNDELLVNYYDSILAWKSADE